MSIPFVPLPSPATVAPSVPRFGVWLVSLALTLAAPSVVPLAAQKPDAPRPDAQRRDASQPSARLTGAIVDRTSGGPVVGAVIVNLTDGRSVTSDSLGTFRVERIPAGLIRFLVRAKGFPSVGLVVAVAQGEMLERRIELDSSAAGATAQAAAMEAAKAARDGRPVATAGTPGAGQALPMVSVSAAASRGPRFANFERRQKTGAGQYLVREEIERGGFSTLAEVARGMRGVAVECSGGRGCYIRMVRAPMRCLPEYIVDDNVDNDFGPTVPVRDIEAMEVYTGPSDVPGEYAGTNAGCGVIVIWTRSGPARKKKD